jgi:serine/threonine-protein kinase
LAAAGALSCLGSLPTASAQSPDAAASETLFRDGKRLLDQKDFVRACPKLAESFRLEPATGTLLALAMCHEGEGKVATAWAEYADAAARSRREGRPDREQAALQWAGALEPKLSTLTISVPDAVAKTAGLEVKRDGVAVGVAAWGTAVPVDPGEHLVEVTAPGKKPWSKGLAIRTPASKEKLAIPPLEEAPRTERALPPSEPAGGGLSAMQQTGLVFGGLGLVAVGVGAYFGLQAIQKNNLSDQGCVNDACDATSKQTRLEARSSGNVATVAFVGGGALLVGGAIMYFAGDSGAGKRSGVRATPAVGQSELGLQVAGSF